MAKQSVKMKIVVNAKLAFGAMWFCLILNKCQSSQLKYAQHVIEKNPQVGYMITKTISNIPAVQCCAFCALSSELCQFRRERKIHSTNNVICEFLKMDDGQLSTNDIENFNLDAAPIYKLEDINAAIPSSQTSRIASYKIVGGSSEKYINCKEKCLPGSIVKFHPDDIPSEVIDLDDGSKGRYWMECTDEGNDKCNCGLKVTVFRVQRYFSSPITLACGNKEDDNLCMCMEY